MGLENKCPNPNDLDALSNMVYPYCPSIGAAFLFCVLFGIVTIAHIVQAVMYRKRYCWVIAMAAAWETVGFGVRLASTQHLDAREDFAVTLVTVSTVFILIAPIWLNAFVYMTFGRMVHYFLPDRKVAKISARFLTLLFVALDISAFIIQVAGALMLSSNGSPQSVIDTGLHVYTAGVALQEVFIVCFFALSLLFRRKAANWPAYREQQRWAPLLALMWAVLGLITVRIMFRIGEYSQGFDSYGATHEWLEYVWDALPMFAAMLAFNVYHPSRALVGPDSEFPKLSRAQKREAKAARKAERRARKEGGVAAAAAAKGGFNGAVSLDEVDSDGSRLV